MKLKSIFNLGYNRLGWKTSRKLIVITSDDWGSVRVESNQARESLIRAGFNMDGSRFNRFDTLESDDDLTALFGVLRKYRDRKGRHPVFTAMTNVANPDFERIEADDFTAYHYEPFTDTAAKSGQSRNIPTLYQQGIKNKIFVPEYHGREHVNVGRWMKALQKNDPQTRKAFDHCFYFPEPTDLSPEFSTGFDAAYDIDSDADIVPQQKIVRDGLLLFAEIFNYGATFFTAPSLTFHLGIEAAAVSNGISLIDVPKLQTIPLGNGKSKKRLNYIGKNGLPGSRYITRNAVFEPNLNPSSDGVSECLSDIATAFKYHQPAIISNHRAAFVGGIDPDNRKNGLAALDLLLTKIVKRWPEAEFISMRELSYIIRNG